VDWTAGGTFTIRILGIVATATPLYVGIRRWYRSRHTTSTAQFQAIRNWLDSQANIQQLTADLTEQQSTFHADKSIPLLTREGWIPPQPLDISAVHCKWNASGNEELRQPIREAYSTAIRDHTPGLNLTNEVSYRLLSVEVTTDSSQLEICEGQYFDQMDTSEILMFESAGLAAFRPRRSVTKGAYRKRLADPFDFTKRCAIPGINTLTIIVDGDSASFLMHKRTKTATSAHFFHVVPAGEFQPQSIAEMPTEQSIWHTMTREYAEEILQPEPQQLTHAVSRLRNTLTLSKGAGFQPFYLGIGLSPSTWKPEVLTACVFDRATFDDAFGSFTETNDEGQLILGDVRPDDHRAGIPFTHERVMDFINRPNTLAAGKACLTLAWKWRNELAIPT
jgi:hypothetical protein